MRSLGAVAVLVLTGCTAVMQASGMPADARRKTPPEGLERALEVGATAPDCSVAMTDGSRASLRGSNTVLLFYRGQW